MFKKVDPKQSLPKMEEGVLKFWNENKIFEKSLENRKDGKIYSFYDGPPFATGTPHYGHLVGSIMKDAVPRYWTMRGFNVPRKWGWDCHGLPIENIAEKELGIKHKTEIEKMGVDKFNEFCRSKVLKYVDEWKTVVNRLGRWADMENSYKTMDLSFMESVWWVFKQLWDKGLIYEGYRTMHICTRCETTLSQSEVAEGYKDIKDLSATVKFELLNDVIPNEAKQSEESRNATGSFANAQDDKNSRTFVLAWTTTPWTLIGNVALAVGEDIDYVKVKCHSELVEESRSNKDSRNLPGSFANAQDDSAFYILAKERLVEGLKDKEYTILKEFKGKELVGKKYKPLFDYYVEKGLDNEENGWQIYAGDFVTTEDGTGIVHIAPAFGEDDAKLGEKYKLPFVQHVGMDGIIKPEAIDFAGMSVKPEGDPSIGSGQAHQSTDVEVIKYLAKKNLLFAKEKYTHSYPHCWRCETPLINYATTSWFVNITKIKEELLKNAENINWIPKHIKEGRFGNWLSGARDWSISRQRFWASVMPIWKCSGNTEKHGNIQNDTEVKMQNGCGNIKVIGSVKELEELSGEKITDIHKHTVDKITFKCEKCGKAMKRIPDVLDTWFDSGSMPYAQAHYPFENKESFDKSFPAQFIAEGVDQTRCWFYYLHAISTAIKGSKAYDNVIVNGIVLAEDGKKMSKRLNNYPDPSKIFDKYGADALRFYLLSSPVVTAETINFKESEVSELVRGMFRMLWNSYSFFVLYANIDKFEVKSQSASRRTKVKSNLLDKWIISELNILIKNINESMEKYELSGAVRFFPKFIDNLSNWYIRRSRKRFWKSEDDSDKKAAYETLHYVLVELSKLMAPFCPFMAEEIYRNLNNCRSERSEEPHNATGSFANAQDDSSCSVHLADFPVADEKMIDEKLNDKMEKVRNIISLGLQLRAIAKIKVRQPLSEIQILVQTLEKGQTLGKEFDNVIKEELNVKLVRTIYQNPDYVIEGRKDENWITGEINGLHLFLCVKITEDLKLEGQAREIIRFIQEMRKEAGYDVENRIEIGYRGAEKVFEKENLKNMIAKEVLANDIKSEELKEPDLEKEFNIDGEKIYPVKSDEVGAKQFNRVKIQIKR